MNRSVEPGYNTKGCSPEYKYKVNCNFAEALYQEVAAVRYGIEFCCETDKNKWLIKKELLDLKLLQDPGVCDTITNNCCGPTCVTAVLEINCQAPSYVIGRIILV